MRFVEVYNELEAMQEPRSAWGKGVLKYAKELIEKRIDQYDEVSPEDIHKFLLDGAEDWKQFSYGGCSLVYDSDIAERLCAPHELKKVFHNEVLRRPNKDEDWLDVQARALFQAERLICKVCEGLD